MQWRPRLLVMVHNGSFHVAKSAAGTTVLERSSEAQRGGVHARCAAVIRGLISQKTGCRRESECVALIPTP